LVVVSPAWVGVLPLTPPTANPAPGPPAGLPQIS
jgi:hypothetical protein